jgi:hypothetical protein
MIYRSTNPEGHAHFGGDVMSGAHSTRGILLSSNTISPVSDNTDEALVLRGKGNGGVYIGASTSAFGGMNRGQSTIDAVLLPVSGLVYSTLTVPGLGVNDMLYIARAESSVMSTAIGMVGYSCTAANEAKIAFLNNLASTQSILADTVFKWNYIKST